MRSAIKRHLVYSSHTDSPIVALEPLRVAWSAVTRKRGNDDGSAGAVVGSSERIDTYAAIWGLTAGPAQQWDLSHVGSLLVGNRADFVILDKDPFTLTDPDQLLNVSVVSTIVDGLAGFRTTTQSLVGMPGLKEAAPLSESPSHAALTKSTLLLAAHRHGKPTLAALAEAKQGACPTKSPQGPPSFPAWFLLGALVILAGCSVALLVKRRRKKHTALLATEELHVSLQVPADEA